MQQRRDLGPTDLVRENGQFLRTVVTLVAGVAGLAALIVVGLLATPAGHLVRELVASSGRTIALHFLLLTAALFLVVMLGSMLGWRRVLAAGRPESALRLLEEARRSILRMWRSSGAVSLVRRSAFTRVDAIDATSSGILAQLCQSLSLSPAAPPRALH